MYFADLLYTQNRVQFDQLVKSAEHAPSASR